MRKELFVVLTILLFLHGCVGSGKSSSTKYASDSSQQLVEYVCSQGTIVAAILPDWFTLSVLAIGVSGVILSLMYVFSVIFSNQGLNAFVKFEIYELFATVVIIFVVMALVKSACAINVGDIFPTSEFKDYNMYGGAFAYFKFLDSRLIGWLAANHFMTMLADQLASSTIYAKPLGLGLVTSPGAGIAGPIKNVLGQMTTAMSVAFIINHAQAAVLEFALVGLVTLYLPIAFVLRSFTPTRRLGGTLIAIALSFLIIYPLLTMVTAEVVYSPYEHTFSGSLSAMKTNIVDGAINLFGSNSYQDYAVWIANLPTGGQQVSTSGTYLPVSGATPTTTQPVGPEEGIGSWLWNLFLAFGKGFVFSMVLIPLSALSMAFVASFIMPALNILISVQAVKSLSKALGDEIDISVLTRLI